MADTFRPQLSRPSSRGIASSLAWIILASGWVGSIGVQRLRAQSGPTTARSAARAVLQHDSRQEGPWSIWIVKVPRVPSAYQWASAHAHDLAIGLAPVSQQVQHVRLPEWTALAAINGDFYQRRGAHSGDPRGLQIRHGELLSAPSGGISFWVDAVGEPHVDLTRSELQVTWPDGTSTPIGLNGARDRGELELYTPAVGESTQTDSGREWILQPEPGTDTWQPLKAGRRYVGRVRDVRDGGNAPIGSSDLVLSAAPGSSHSRLQVGPGARVVLSTATTPNLRGVRTALSGGPILVREGKRQRIPPAEGDDYESSSMHERHPRSALGWNEQFYFLVQVDGRQPGQSVGMTLRELSEYMVRLGCREGINLDGGGSSTLWFDGQVRNRPCDGEERAVANALVLLQRIRSTSPAE